VHTITEYVEAADVVELYIKKYGKGKDFLELLKAGKNHHQLYCLTPRSVMLFDERSGVGVPYKQIHLTD
jgi:hypothetical protein